MKFLQHINIARKLALSFSILIILTILMAGILLSAISDIKASDKTNSTAQKLSKTYLQYKEAFAEQRQGLLYYLLTGDRDGLKQYNNITPIIAANYTKLHELAEEDASINQSVTALKKTL